MEQACHFSKFKKGTVVISIDDGNADDFRLYENVLLKYHLPATFNIVSSTIGGEGTLTREQLREIYRDPLMEIAAHGYAHQNDDEDITKGIAELSDWLGIKNGRIGFASPGSNMKNAFIEQNADHLRSLGLLYVRTAGNPNPNPRHLELQDKWKEAGVSEYILKNIPQLIDSFDSMCVNSVVVYNHTALDDLKRLVEIASEEHACVVFMFHRTKKENEPNYDELWCYDYNKMAEFAAYLAKKRDEGVIDVVTNRRAFLTACTDAEASC